MNMEKICSKFNWSVFPKYTIKGISNVFHTVDYLIRKEDKEYAVFLTKKENLINVYLKSIVFHIDSKIPTLVLVENDTSTNELQFHHPGVQIFENIEQFEDFLSKI